MSIKISQLPIANRPQGTDLFIVNDGALTSAVTYTDLKDSLQEDLAGGTNIVLGDMNVGSGTLFVDESENNVGINTLFPSADLDVVGDVVISGTTTGTGNASFGGSVNSGDSDNGVWLYNNGGIQSWNSATLNVNITNTGNATFAGRLNIGDTPVYADNAAATAGGLADGDVYRKADGTLMVVFT